MSTPVVPENVGRVTEWDVHYRSQNQTDRTLLSDLRSKLDRYLLEFRWVDEVQAVWWGTGVPPLVGVCLVRIVTASDVDDFLWVIVGDLPSAYLVLDDLPTPQDAALCYLDHMKHWVDGVRNGADLGECMPVDVDATTANALLLQKRIDLLGKWFKEGNL
jgi:hypothetical protein